MRDSGLFRKFVIAFLAALLASLACMPAFAAKEGYRIQSLTADQAYGGVSGLLVASGSAQIFAVAYGGGVSRSNDSGATWTPKNSGLTNLDVRSIQQNGAIPSNVFVATTGGAGFYMSTNSGDTWVGLATGTLGLDCRNVQNIAVFTNSGNTASPHIFAATGCPGSTSGLYKSEDGGSNWQKVPLNLPPGAVAQSVNFSFNASTLAYSGRVATSVGWYQVQDGGPGHTGTYANINGTATPGPIGQNGLYSFGTANVTSGTHVLAAVVAVGVYRSPLTSGWVSSTGSAVWTPVLGNVGAPKQPISGIFSRFNTGVAATSDPNRYVTIDGEGTYLSTDSGATWALDPLLNFSKMVRGVVRDGLVSTTFWATTLHGIYKSTDSMATWSKVTAAGLPGAYVSRVIVNNALTTQLWSSGTLSQSSSDGGATWSVMPGIAHISFPAGDLRATSSGAIVFATTGSGGVYRSVNSGLNWGQLPLLTTGSVGPIGRLTLASGSSSNNFYLAVGNFGLAGSGGGKFGSYDDRSDKQKLGLYRTSDNGSSWTTLLTGSVGSVNAVSEAPGNPTTVLAATGGGIYKSTDNGVNWRLVGPTVVYATNSVSSFGANSVGVGYIEHDPLNANNVLAGAYDVDNQNRATALSALYRSTDGGESWQSVVAYEKIGGVRFVTLNNKSVPYVVSHGTYDQVNDDGQVFRCPDLFTRAADDLRNVSCSPLAPQRMADGTPVQVNAQTILPGISPLGVATRNSGFQKFARTNIGPDFNNDGVADVLWRNTGAGGQNFIWRMQKGDSGRSLVHQAESAFLPTVPTNWVIGGYGDFNGDGNTDILWRDTATGNNYIYLMDGVTVLAGSGFILNVPTAWSVAGTGDFDGDGKDDILWRNGTTGDNYLYVMNGLTVQGTSGYLPSVPTNWTASTGDFNGDGKADILWRNTTTGDNYMYQMNGTAVTTQGYLPSAPVTWNVAGISDLDGDGNFDIVWRNSAASGENYVYFMNGLTVLGTSGYLPTVADVNWVIKGVGNYTNDLAARGILWSNPTTRSNFLWRMNRTGLNIDSACGTLGCDNSANYLPSAPAGWAIIK